MNRDSARSNQHIFIIAGEHSGDLLGASLIEAIKETHPDWVFSAMGGKPLEKAGATIIVPNDNLAIIGFIEVLRHLKKLFTIFNQIKQFIRNTKPDLIILIDYPGFNLKVAAFAHKQGCKVLYYTSPQIWAWKVGRIKRIKRDVDHMAVLFPFEETLYQQAEVPVTVVGHPMLQRFEKIIAHDDARNMVASDLSIPLLAILPGSRASEIKRLMPVILNACKQLKTMIPDLKIIIALADTIETIPIPDVMQSYMSVLPGKTDAIVAASDAVICASGTATLEVALAEKPMVIIYKTSAVTYWLAKVFMKIPYIGLCNIVTNDGMVKELIQGALTPKALTDETYQLLTNKSYCHHIKRKLQKTKNHLGDKHQAKLLVAVIDNLMLSHH